MYQVLVYNDLCDPGVMLFSLRPSFSHKYPRIPVGTREWAMVYSGVENGEDSRNQRDQGSVRGCWDPLIRALSGRLKFTVRRHKSNEDSLLVGREAIWEGGLVGTSGREVRLTRVSDLITCWRGGWSGCKFAAGTMGIPRVGHSERVLGGHL